MEKNFIQLSDNFRAMEIDIMKGEKTDLDFFRFMPARRKVLSQNIKRLIRRKFRATVIKFVHQKRAGILDQLPALDALKLI